MGEEWRSCSRITAAIHGFALRLALRRLVDAAAYAAAVAAAIRVLPLDLAHQLWLVFEEVGVAELPRILAEVRFAVAEPVGVEERGKVVGPGAQRGKEILGEREREREREGREARDRVRSLYARPVRLHVAPGAPRTHMRVPPREEAGAGVVDRPFALQRIRNFPLRGRGTPGLCQGHNAPCPPKAHRSAIRPPYWTNILDMDRTQVHTGQTPTPLNTLAFQVLSHRKCSGSVSPENLMLSVTTKESPFAPHAQRTPLLSTISRSFWRNALSGFFGVVGLLPVAGLLDLLPAATGLLPAAKPAAGFGCSAFSALPAAAASVTIKASPSRTTLEGSRLSAAPAAPSWCPPAAPEDGESTRPSTASPGTATAASASCVGATDELPPTE